MSENTRPRKKRRIYKTVAVEKFCTIELFPANGSTE